MSERIGNEPEKLAVFGTRSGLVSQKEKKKRNIQTRKELIDVNQSTQMVHTWCDNLPNAWVKVIMELLEPTKSNPRAHNQGLPDSLASELPSQPQQGVSGTAGNQQVKLASLHGSCQSSADKTVSTTLPNNRWRKERRQAFDQQSQEFITRTKLLRL
ncbi:hypothetical protein CROQUDRAFT_129722 [Cronartium quercuum f. sp. fusiforme G11]|uniref:Uncharacterized protein n=1 Tax=Cronartium quercuum f. sp. fusiforme G11 TaxID=708437 RepID=A0A9P6THM3_9BASI|nr:hypothetical protein CROQUDRAFT_129722 [Cronartium quercuum f. sp. fusiforme G11]